MGQLSGLPVVRPAVPVDKMAVIRLLRDAHTAAGFSTGASPFAYPFQAAYAERAFLSHTSSADAACFVLEVERHAVGVLLARVFDYELGPLRLAKETAWWIDPDHRGKAASAMLDAYEAWAASRGASVAGMAALEIAPRAGVIYRRRHYQAVETHFVKALSPAA
jgi:GNAT superfamily N-acetyltransferase